MPRHDDRVSVRQMLDYSREAVSLCQNRSRSDLDTDRLLCLALVRLTEIVGEAASRVSTSERQHHPEIPWSQIVALRNRLIHGYDAIDFDILWTVLSVDMSELIRELEKIIPPDNT